MKTQDASRQRRAPAPVHLGAAVAAAAVVLLGGTATAQQAEVRVEGEYSLAVTRDSGRLTVRWLVPERKRGVFEALLPAGRTVHRDTTPEAAGHRVRFPVPDAGRLLLRYGTAGAESLHETAVRLLPGSDRPRRSMFGVLDSLWVVGDVHGEYDRLRSLLENAGLIDDAGHWTGGRSHLVFLGDLMDRGPYATRTLWFVYRLEEEAREAGGRVSVVLGNHELMVLTGDHRYVSGQERLLATRHGLSYWEMYHPRRSVLGRWLTRQPAALKVGEVVLAHGGIGPAYLERGIRELNDSLASFVSEDLFEYWADSTVEITRRDSAAVFRRVRFLFEAPSPFWYRGYARGDTLGAALRRMLERHDARMHVIAHTPVPAIRSAYGDSLLMVDLETPASEMLLLTRNGDSYGRWVYGTDGEPRRLGTSGAGGGR